MKPTELKTYTMQELYEQPLEPVEYLVDGLLAPGLYILGGSPKVGKSWMALQLCLAVCGGKAFLGRETQTCEVLYLALEDGPQRLHSRALRLADTAPEGLHLCHRAAPIGQGLERQIEAQLAEYPHIRLVVLDTLQKVRCVSGSGDVLQQRLRGRRARSRRWPTATASACWSSTICARWRTMIPSTGCPAPTGWPVPRTAP